MPEVDAIIGVKVTGDKKAQATLRRLGTAYGKGPVRGARQLGRANSQVARSFSFLGRTAKGAQFAVVGINKELAITAALLTGGLTLVRFIDEFRNLEGRVRQATRETGAFTKSWEGLVSIAQTAGVELSTTVSLFQGISRVRKELDVTNSQMIEFTSNVAKLGVISGATAEQQRAGLLQLQQGLAAGVVRAEEFNSLIENIPAVAQAIAEELAQGSVGALRKMVIEGQLFSKDVLQAILNKSEEIEKRFKEMPVTMQRGFSALKTGFGVFVNELDKSLGFTEALGEELRDVGLALAALDFDKMEEDISKRVDELSAKFDLLTTSMSNFGATFNETIFTVGGSVKGSGSWGLLAEILTAINAIAITLTETFSILLDGVFAFGNLVSFGLGKFIGSAFLAKEGADGMADALDGVTTSGLNIIRALTTEDQFKAIAEGMAFLGDKTAKTILRLEEMAEIAAEVKVRTQELNEQLGTVVFQGKEREVIGTARAAQLLSIENEAARKKREALDAQKKLFKDINALITSSKTEEEKLKEQIDLVNKAAAEGFDFQKAGITKQELMNRLMADTLEAQKKITEEIEKQNQAADERLSDLQGESALLDAKIAGNEELVTQLERQMFIEKELAALGEDVTEERRKQIELTAGDVFDKQKIVDQTEEAAGAMEKIFDRMGENIQRAWGDMIFDMLFVKGIDSFGDFADAVLEIFKRMIAEMIAAWTFAFLANTLLKGVPGFGQFGGGFGFGGGGGGGFGGLATNFAIGKGVDKVTGGKGITSIFSKGAASGGGGSAAGGGGSILLGSGGAHVGKSILAEEGIIGGGSKFASGSGAFSGGAVLTKDIPLLANSPFSGVNALPSGTGITNVPASFATAAEAEAFGFEVGSQIGNTARLNPGLISTNPNALGVLAHESAVETAIISGKTGGTATFAETAAFNATLQGGTTAATTGASAGIFGGSAVGGATTAQGAIVAGKTGGVLAASEIGAANATLGASGAGFGAGLAAFMATPAAPFVIGVMALTLSGALGGGKPPEQIVAEALQSGVESLDRRTGLRLFGEGENVTLRDPVGSAFSTFAQQEEGIGSIETEFGNLITGAGGRFGERGEKKTAKTIEELKEEFSELQKQIEMMLPAVQTVFDGIANNAARLRGALTDGVLQVSEQIGLGFELLGDITTDEFDKITKAIQEGELRMAALRGEVAFTAEELRVLADLGIDILGAAQGRGDRRLGINQIRGFSDAPQAAAIDPDAVNVIQGSNRAMGGSFMVGGVPGVDNNLLQMRVSRGERVTVDTVEQQRANRGDGMNVSVVINGAEDFDSFRRSQNQLVADLGRALTEANRRNR